jgi:hypothetical protein
MTTIIGSVLIFLGLTLILVPTFENSKKINVTMHYPDGPIKGWTSAMNQDSARLFEGAVWVKFTNQPDQSITWIPK